MNRRIDRLYAIMKEEGYTAEQIKRLSNDMEFLYDVKIKTSEQADALYQMAVDELTDSER